MFTREDIDNIQEMSLNSPILRTSLEFWRHGHVSLENAVAMAVEQLVKQNEDLFKMLSEREAHGYVGKCEGCGNTATCYYSDSKCGRCHTKEM